MKNIKNNIMYQIFLWMFVGLLVTFITGYVVSLNTDMVNKIFGTYVRYILIFAELGIGIFLGARVWKLKPATATCLYLLYAFLTGLTISAIFIVYKVSSLLAIFLVASGLFGIFGVFGFITKIDISKISTFLLMMLIGIIVLGLVNMFLGSSLLNTVLSIVGLVVFLGYTAYDLNRIKKMMEYGETGRNAAISGAFSLYLDYIHIFMDLLDLFGDRR